MPETPSHVTILLRCSKYGGPVGIQESGGRAICQQCGEDYTMDVMRVLNSLNSLAARQVAEVSKI